MAVIAAHLGIVDEEAIDNMSFVFFEDVLAELNHRLTFDAISNYAGNSFFEKSWEIIMENHPLLMTQTDGTQAEQSKTMQGLAELFG